MINMSENITDYKSAFRAFHERFLENKQSIFDEDKDKPVFTEESISYLIENFVENGNDGKEIFIEKLKGQLKEETDAGAIEVRKNAIEILATAAWLWRLAPRGISVAGRKNSVNEILELPGGPGSLKSNKYFSEKIKGFAAPGMYYYTNKPFELAYIIRFFERWLESKGITPNAIDVLNKLTVKVENKEHVGKVEIKTEGAAPSVKSVAVYNALLHLFDSENYVPALSFDHKKKMVEAFYDKNDGKATVDEKLKEIMKKIRQENSSFKSNDFYSDRYREKWDPQLLPAKNVIYYGAPGTGKTYQVTQLVERKTSNNSENFKIQQFHPSFGYEDFIDGVKPDCINGTGMSFQLVNGEFKEMCIRAFKELVRFQSLPSEHKKNKHPKQFYFIADEINRAELSRVFGELLLCLEEDKRLSFDEKGKLHGAKIKTQNSGLWSKEHAVVILKDQKVVDVIGNPDEPEKLDWASDGEEYFFGVPDNLYFLGTMNDIDRRIDSFDLALRRRFKWIHKGCDYDVIADCLLSKGIGDDVIAEYAGEKGRCALLNEYISQTLNLGASYELGHSYYMEIDVHHGKISKAAYERLFDSEMAPLLAEYLRAEYSSGKELEGKLKEMRKLFTEEKI